jgi:hypothetical protein
MKIIVVILNIFIKFNKKFIIINKTCSVFNLAVKFTYFSGNSYFISENFHRKKSGNFDKYSITFFLLKTYFFWWNDRND